MEAMSHFWQLCCVAERSGGKAVEAGNNVHNLSGLAYSNTTHAGGNKKAQQRVLRVQVGDNANIVRS